MRTRDDRTTLRQMRDHAGEAIDAARGHTREHLDSGRLFMHALTHLVEIVGEAAGRVSHEFQRNHPDIPWQDITGMRHRLIHAYDEVDLAILWQTVREDLPALIERLDAVLDEEAA